MTELLALDSYAKEIILRSRLPLIDASHTKSFPSRILKGHTGSLFSVRSLVGEALGVEVGVRVGMFGLGVGLLVGVIDGIWVSPLTHIEEYFGIYILWYASFTPLCVAYEKPEK